MRKRLIDNQGKFHNTLRQEVITKQRNYSCQVGQNKSNIEINIAFIEMGYMPSPCISDDKIPLLHPYFRWQCSVRSLA